MGCPEISREIKTLLTFMLRDEESENYGYTASSYIYRILRMGCFQYINQVSYSSRIIPRYILQK